MCSTRSAGSSGRPARTPRRSSRPPTPPATDSIDREIPRATNVFRADAASMSRRAPAVRPLVELAVGHLASPKTSAVASPAAAAVSVNICGSVAHGAAGTAAAGTSSASSTGEQAQLRQLSSRDARRARSAPGRPVADPLATSARSNRSSTVLAASAAVLVRRGDQRERVVGGVRAVVHVERRACRRCRCPRSAPARSTGIRLEHGQRVETGTGTDHALDLRQADVVVVEQGGLFAPGCARAAPPASPAGRGAPAPARC